MIDYRIDGKYSDEIEKILEQLGDILPHGSGIDYTWSIEQKKNGFIYASNSFHAMDEFGGYCHIYDFTAKYKYNGADNYKPCELCDGTGKRLLSDVHKYHPTMSHDQRIKFLNDQSITVYQNSITDEFYFFCRNCSETGKIKLNIYELLNVNFHGQKERNCCGYGLKDYLYQILYLD